jgi:hypothetical protein
MLGLAGGVSTTTGWVWREQRKFMLKHLSDLGMAKKNTLESLIGEECQELVNALLVRCSGTKGCASEGRRRCRLLVDGGLFAPAVNNVIWRMVTGRRTRWGQRLFLNRVFSCNIKLN